jgi:Tol biopolymer transport system component
MIKKVQTMNSNTVTKIRIYVNIWGLILCLAIFIFSFAQSQDSSASGPINVVVNHTDNTHERVIYSSFRPEGWNLYLHSEPGTDAEQITDHPALDYEATVSPDGRWVVFTSERNGHPSLFVMNFEERGDPRLLVRSDAMEDQAAISPDGRWLVFVSTADGNSDIYRLPFRPQETLDISEAVNLTDHTAGDFRPAFSPDGRWITFSSDRRPPPRRLIFMQRRAGDIYRISTDGGEAELMAKSVLWNGSPAWSADGKTLWFYRETEFPTGPDHSSFTLASIDSETLEEIELKHLPDLPVLAPVPMPDGRIAFTTWEGPLFNRSFRVKALDPVTGEVSTISDPAIDCFSPIFLPGRDTAAMICHGGPRPEPSLADFGGALHVAGTPKRFSLPDRDIALYGVRKMFAAPPHPNRNELVMRAPQSAVKLMISNLDGSNSRSLIDVSEHHDYPSDYQILNLRWTPDGKSAIFSVSPFLAAPDTTADIWAVGADGSGLKRLIESPYNDGFAEFSDNGRMVFRSGRDGNHDVFLVNAPGEAPINLTKSNSRDIFPAISPDGKRIAFASDRNTPDPGPDGVKAVNLYIMDVDAEGIADNLRQITDNHAHDAHVQFSPDGEWLIYTSGKNGIHDEEPLVQTVIFGPQMYGDIYAYRISDGHTERLTHSKWENGAPLWAAPANNQ